MRDLSDRVGAPRSSTRFPFDAMTTVGDHFTAPVARGVLSAAVSSQWAGTGGRRFACFAVRGGTRVFLVDIDHTESAAA